MEVETTKRFCSICDAEAEMPADTLAGMAETARALARTFKEPHRRGGPGWSPLEIAVHLADTEIVFAWRVRRILAEDEPQVQPYDQERWAAALGYAGRELATALATFAANRSATLEILRALPEAGWQRAYTQPEYGRRTLRDLVQHISDHDLAHLRQIRAG